MFELTINDEYLSKKIRYMVLSAHKLPIIINYGFTGG